MPSDAGGAHYYADGRRQALDASDLVAIDLDDLDDVDAGTRDALRGHGRALSGGVVLVEADTAERLLGERLGRGSGVHPVFEADGATVVVLAEVRVEGPPEALRRVRRGAEERATVDETEGRLVLHPRSHRGADALALANEIAEDPELDLAQARFLRVTPRPDTHP